MLSSVCIITYNHEKYIAQAIEGALMQKTNFDFEIVIGEDCSTDKTRDNVIEYAKKYPDKIRAILNDHNIGPTPNFLNTLKNCRGKYIALCEGDDYWTDPYKLQKQVDFLESHPQYSVCFHHANIVNYCSQVISKNGCNGAHLYTQEDFFLGEGKCSWTCSMVFRKNCLPSIIPNWFYKVNAGDMFLKLILTENNCAFVMKDVMACYRVHSGGIWSTLGIIHIYDKKYNDLCILISKFGKRYEKYANFIKDKFCFVSIYYYIYKKQYKKALKSLVRITRYPKYILNNVKDFTNRFIAILFPYFFYYYYVKFYEKNRHKNFR